MKQQTVLKCILGSAICLSQLNTSTAQASLPVSSEEVQAYAINATNTIYATLEQILSIAPENRTYENTLRPWHQLKVQLTQDFSNLKDVEALKTLMDELIETAINHELYQTLIHFAKKAQHDETLNPLQRTISKYIAGNKINDFVHLQGAGPEKQTSDNFTLLNLEAKTLLTDQIPITADNILAADPDIVCLQNIFAEDEAFAIYGALQNNYAHFYVYINRSLLTINPTSPTHNGSLLIASKLPIKNIRYNKFQLEAKETNEGFFDLLVTTPSAPLAHIYAAHLQPQTPDIKAHKIAQILEKMNSDRLSHNLPIPYLLCGDFDLHNPTLEPAKALLHQYFRPDISNPTTGHAFLLNTYEFTTLTSFIPILPDRAALLTAIYPEPHPTDTLTIDSPGNNSFPCPILLCKSKSKPDRDPNSDKDHDKDHDKDKDKHKDKEKDRDKDKERQRELEKMQQKERDIQAQLEREREKERQRQLERNRESKEREKARNEREKERHERVKDRENTSSDSNQDFEPNWSRNLNAYGEYNTSQGVSAIGSLEFSQENENGAITSINIEGSVTLDNDGNVSGKASLEADWDF